MKLSKMNFRDQRVQVGILVVLVVILSSYCWYEYVFTPKWNDVSGLKQKNEQKQTELNTIFANRPQLSRLRENVDKMKMTLDSLRAKFPDQKEVARLIREITIVANQSGIRTISFIPKPDVVTDHYVENNYTMEIIGGYHDLANFFSYLTDFQMIINVSNVVIRTNPNLPVEMTNNSKSGNLPRTVDASFTMTTFSSKR